MTEQLTTFTPDSPAADSPTQNHDVFASIYSNYYPKVLGMLRRRGAGSEAEDIAQEAFTKVFAKLDTQTKEGSIYGWVMQIAANTHIDHIRRNQRCFIDYTDDTEIFDRVIPPAAEARPSDMQVLEVLDLEATRAQIVTQLSREQAEALDLTIQGYSTAEISTELGAKPVTVRSRVHRGREALKAAGIRPGSN